MILVCESLKLPNVLKLNPDKIYVLNLTFKE